MTPDTLAEALARAGDRPVKAMLPVHLRGDVCDLPS
jgi:dTDP-4-amino-4,6-dideoxygalactose transaminase